MGSGVCVYQYLLNVFLPRWETLTFGHLLLRVLWCLNRCLSVCAGGEGQWQVVWPEQQQILSVHFTEGWGLSTPGYWDWASAKFGRGVKQRAHLHLHCKPFYPLSTSWGSIWREAKLHLHAPDEQNPWSWGLQDWMVASGHNFKAMDSQRMVLE